MKDSRKTFFVNLLIAIYLSLNLAYADEAASFNYLTINSVNKMTPAEGGLYQQIYDELKLEYENIGRREAERALENSRWALTGGLNSVGFTYKRPFVDFSISVDRNLAPDLFDDKRWIVTDTFTVDIDASRVLGNLRDQEAIDMSAENYAAFAGIVFKRKFTWVHFANSYEDGLMRDFDKLFMPFRALSFAHINKISANEMIFREDSISFKAGGIVSAPIYTGVTGMAGVLAKFERLSKVEVIADNGSDPMKNSVHINFERSKIATAGASLAIQADFMKILKMTLLSYDFSYELESSYKIYLSLKQLELKEMTSENPVAKEIEVILRQKEADLKVLAPYIISEEKKIAQSISHKYNIFLLGGQKNSKTQQIEITKEGKVKTFFRHFYEKVKYTDDGLSRLFASFIYAIMNVDISANKLASDSKKIEIEYDSERNLLDEKEDLNIGEKGSNEQKLSMNFSSDFKTNKTKGSLGEKYRERAKFILERFSGVDPLAIGMIEREYLVAPFHITGRYQVNIDGIRHLNSQPVGVVLDHLSGLCDEYPKNKFINFRNLFDGCRRSLQNDYIDYYKDLSHDKVTSDVIDVCEKKARKYFFFPSKKRAFIKNCLSELTVKTEADWVEIPLWPLKNFASNIVNNSYSKVHYYNLFGVSNVFFFGTFDALTGDGRDFTTSFHEGAFKGLGAVDHYMRNENLRAPSSVVVDQ